VLKNETMLLHCDNVAAINIANNPVQFDRIKHVKIDRFSSLSRRWAVGL
jgi:hypothetical protein